MRTLTLDEKITIRGIAGRRGIVTNPRFETADAVRLVRELTGRSVVDYAKVTR